MKTGEGREVPTRNGGLLGRVGGGEKFCVGGEKAIHHCSKRGGEKEVLKY